MGLLTGRRNETTTTGTGTGTGTTTRYLHSPHANPTVTGLGHHPQHRYETRSHGPLSSGPGTSTAATNTGRTGFFNKRTNAGTGTTSAPMTGTNTAAENNGLGTTGVGHNSVGTGRRGMGTNANTTSAAAPNSGGITGSTSPLFGVYADDSAYDGTWGDTSDEGEN
jgi:hypothetical protein